jgi:hypothetical protein
LIRSGVCGSRVGKLIDRAASWRAHTQVVEAWASEVANETHEEVLARSRQREEAAKVLKGRHDRDMTMDLTAG